MYISIHHCISYVHLSIHSSINSSIYSSHLSSHSFIHPFIPPSIHPSIHPSMHPFIPPSIHLFLHPPIYSSIHPPIYSPLMHSFDVCSLTLAVFGRGSQYFVCVCYLTLSEKLLVSQMKYCQQGNKEKMKGFKKNTLRSAFMPIFMTNNFHLLTLVGLLLVTDYITS